jgi:NADH dehydrogenase/NADH:ubiquinone oxidoreductase subunit G
VPDDARIDVVLPMTHAYERQASITNLEGRVQLQDGGAAAPPHARADWSVVATLFGGPTDLDAIREALLEQHPTLPSVLLAERLIARV